MKTSRSTVFFIILVSQLLLCGTAVQADWDVGDPHKMHFPQLPDLQNGMNVLATRSLTIADDFLCTETGYITDIHIWGSWLGDLFPVDPASGNSGPGEIAFRLAIKKDIPADESPNDFSIPGELLWQRNILPGEFQTRFWTTSVERFFDPDQNEVIGQDTEVYQYNFLFDEDVAFFQEEGNIYWLQVQAYDPNDTDRVDHDALFGWKTSADHWNDDSVWGHLVPLQALPSPWGELTDPETRVSLDQAFVITPEPATLIVMTAAGLALLLRRRRCQG